MQISQRQPAESSISGAASVRMDALRGIAALAVVLGHSREKLSWLQPTGHQRLETIVLVPTAFAEEAVAVFFVLSGYLVGGQVVRQVRQDRFTWGTYLVKRFSRLWTVLLPGLLLTAGTDVLSKRINPQAFSLVVRQDDGRVLDMLCNAAFLNPTRCGNFGSNDSLWSLAYEFWFYILFAGAMWAVFGFFRRNWARGTAGSMVAAGAVLAFGPTVIPLMLAWLMGVAVAAFVGARPDFLFSGRSTMVSAVSVLVVSMLASTVLDLPRIGLQVLVGISASFLVWTMVTTRPQRRLVGGVVLAAKAGGWSFSTYVFHLPLITLALSAGAPLLIGHENVQTVLVYVLAIMAVVAVYPLSLVTESHTAAVRRWLMSLVVTNQERTSPLR